MGPVGEFRLVPDPTTFVVLPYAPHSGMLLCDLYTTADRHPWAACPRTFLKRMIAAAAGMGVALQAAVEHEFYLARETPCGGDDPFYQTLCSSSLGLRSTGHVMHPLLPPSHPALLQLE